MRIFLDANILFSAAKADGAVRRLLDLLLDSGHQCWIDGYVLEEARRNLAVKTAAGTARLEELLPRLRLADLHPNPAAMDASLQIAEKDRPVVAAAIGLRCEALVTGDRTHFGRLYGKTVGGVTIHSPRSLAEALLVESNDAPDNDRSSRR